VLARSALDDGDIFLVVKIEEVGEQGDTQSVSEADVTVDLYTAHRYLLTALLTVTRPIMSLLFSHVGAVT
jgi:hypothetical protein